jgi:hypothetical protein
MSNMMLVSAKNASDAAAPSWVLKDFAVLWDFVSGIIPKFLVSVASYLA